MARKRMIDPEIWRDSRVIKLSNNAFILFIGVISTADDEGIIEPDAESYFFELARRELSIDKIKSGFEELFKVGILIPYDDKKYAFLHSWFKHQYIERPYETKRKRPPFEIVIQYKEYIDGWEKTFSTKANTRKYPIPRSEKWEKTTENQSENSAGTFTDHSVNVPLPFTDHSPPMEINRKEINRKEEKEILGENQDFDEEITFPESPTIQLEEEKDFSLPFFKKLCIAFMKVYNQQNGQVASPTGGNYTKAADIFNCENPEKLYNQAIQVIDYFFKTPFWFNTEKKEPGKIKKHLCTLGVFLAHLPAIIADYNEKQEVQKLKTENENTGDDYAKMMDERRRQVEEERAIEGDVDQDSSPVDPGG